MDQSLKLCNPMWTELWNEGISPGEAFDMNSVSPLLSVYIQKGLVPPGRALVPGCGRGYDVTALATTDRYVIGLDIADKAIEAAKERLESLSEDMCACKGNSDFQTYSFFEVDATDPNYKFDFIYDYTFLCALDPSVRNYWAEQMARLVKPGGVLLTLIYPIRPPDDKGPPFSVSLELLRELLQPVGFECLELDMLPAQLCHEGRDGSEEGRGTSGIGRWKRL
jgi:SAM-dependent methyltransferase